MSEKLYEDLDIKDDHFFAGLDKIVDAINYDTNKVEKTLYRLEVTKDYALSRVSKESLDEIIVENRNVATHDCNLYKFNNINFDFLHKRLSRHLVGKNIKSMGISGRIWYPVNGYMGWHTNSNNKGYRIYCTFAREGEKSFFRFRDPETEEIITSWDKQGWNFRMFKIGEKPIWHSVFSETDRISIGYSLYTS
jgi:hypothetical protein